MPSMPSSSRNCLFTLDTRVCHCPAPGGTQSHCTSVRSDSGSEDLISVSNSSKGTVDQHMEICVTLQRYSSTDHHWPTAKPLMLEDDADTITFSTASPDTFTSVTCAQCEPALIHKENKVPMLELLILVFSGKCRSSCTVLYCEHRSHYRTSGPHTTPMESVSDWSVWSVTCTSVPCWRSFCRALAVLLLFLLTHGADTSPDVSSPHVSPPSIFSMFLRLCWETHQTLYGMYDVQSWRSWTICATWLCCRYCLMIQGVRRTLKTRLETNQSG